MGRAMNKKTMKKKTVKKKPIEKKPIERTIEKGDVEIMIPDAHFQAAQVEISDERNWIEVAKHPKFGKYAALIEDIKPLPCNYQVGVCKSKRARDYGMPPNIHYHLQHIRRHIGDGPQLKLYRTTRYLPNYKESSENHKNIDDKVFITMCDKRLPDAPSGDEPDGYSSCGGRLPECTVKIPNLGWMIDSYTLGLYHDGLPVQEGEKKPKHPLTYRKHAYRALHSIFTFYLPKPGDMVEGDVQTWDSILEEVHPGLRETVDYLCKNWEFEPTAFRQEDIEQAKKKNVETDNSHCAKKAINAKYVKYGRTWDGYDFKALYESNMKILRERSTELDEVYRSKEICFYEETPKGRYYYDVDDEESGYDSDRPALYNNQKDNEPYPYENYQSQLETVDSEDDKGA
ncbi:hypothetical protein BDV25DRAFT_135232 [Aspergillus avenaceus]|uniref:Uncharacterized protein n=1 Tax=Aspergillus avenaceus TaxID=36643 RepID=A0A5N6U986_ASPAV|nr:hypothetical protein BDV25DRAFT_135232 [Aspergillus avenaceus]